MKHVHTLQSSQKMYSFLSYSKVGSPKASDWKFTKPQNKERKIYHIVR